MTCYSHLPEKPLLTEQKYTSAPAYGYSSAFSYYAGAALGVRANLPASWGSEAKQSTSAFQDPRLARYCERHICEINKK